jgi:hypothetical protein
MGKNKVYFLDEQPKHERQVLMQMEGLTWDPSK